MATAMMLLGLRTTARNAMRGARAGARTSRINNGSLHGRPENMRAFLYHRPSLGSSFRMNGLHTGVTPASIRNAASRQVVRPVSYTSIPRLAFRVVGRLPVILAGGSVAGGAYVVTKVEAARSSVYEWLDEASSTVGNAASTIKEGAGSAFQALGAGASDANDFGKSIWDRLKSSVEELLESSSEGGDGSSNSSAGGSPRPLPERVAAAAAVAASAPLLMDDRDEPTDEATNDLMVLTKKLIEIRSILLTIDHGEGLQLPAIVTIGSQSSGKSSVLEAIVGREFLPKYVWYPQKQSLMEIQLIPLCLIGATTWSLVVPSS